MRQHLDGEQAVGSLRRTDLARARGGRSRTRPHHACLAHLALHRSRIYIYIGVPFTILYGGSIYICAKTRTLAGEREPEPAV